MNINIENLIIDLRTLTKVGPGMKLNTKDISIKLDDNTILQGMFRWHRGDTRDGTYDKVHSLIQNSMKVVKMAIIDYNDPEFEDPSILYLDSTPEEFLNMIYHILIGVKSGLEKLKQTYSGDLQLMSKFETDISYVINQLSIIKRAVNIVNTPK